ncbi:protein 4.1-like [Aphidius gifuensis]|nr:protein 4.1-like [Aphidius gifuensis]
MDPILFTFRVKFYPPDPLRLREEITRYQIYQQLKRDLLHGRLYCSPGEAALLAACILHNELGEYDPEIHMGNYISELKILLKQTDTIEEKAMELHQTQLKGFTAEQAEIHFLRIAAQLDTYAVDPHPVKDHKGTQLYLGINHHGILTFQGSKKTNHFRWSEVQKINYEGKMFIVHLTITEDLRTKKKHTVGFKCPTGSNRRHVWRCAIEQMLFFTLPKAADAPVVSGGSIFSWGTKFKYTGRTEREVLEENAASLSSGEGSSLRSKSDTPVQRCQTSGLRRKASSVPATPSTPSQDLIEIRYSSLPRSCHSAGLDGAGMSESGTSAPTSGQSYCPDNTLPSLETVSEDQEIYAKRNNAVDENEKSHASATHTTSITNQVKNVHIQKSTFRTLYSQKIIINSDEIKNYKNIDELIKMKINKFDKNSNIIRSTALIIKTSRTPIKKTTKIIQNKKNNIINNNNNSMINNNFNINKNIDTINNCDNDILILTESPRKFKDKIQYDTVDNNISNDKKNITTKAIMKYNNNINNNNIEFNQKFNNENVKSIIKNNNYNNNSDNNNNYNNNKKNNNIDSLIINNNKSPMAFAMAMAGAVAAAAASLQGYPSNTQDLSNIKNAIEASGGQSGDMDTNDYYFRDSFDHSSSESQHLDVIGKIQNRTTNTQIPKMKKLQNSKLYSQSIVDDNCDYINRDNSNCKKINDKTKKLRGIRIFRLFVSTFLITITILFIVIVLIYETESTLFDSFRKIPEILTIKNLYYAPIKEFLRTKLGLF